jgi:hypothetical protein
MDQICAIIDAQGFYLNNKFYIRECAIVSDKLSHCQEFYTNINFDELTSIDKNNVIHCKRNIHGLLLNPYMDNLPLPSSDGFIHYIKYFYDVLSSKEKPLFAVKHEPLKRLLESSGIPVCDLNDKKYKIPKIADLEEWYGNRWTCAYHIKSNYVLRCAYRKCIHLYNYIRENFITDEPMNMEENIINDESMDID